MMIKICKNSVDALTFLASPTEVLARAQTRELSSLAIYRLVQRGFALEDAQAMLSMSTLYSATPILERIMGRSTRTVRRYLTQVSEVRLDAQQSAVAYQYAKVLEMAMEAFDTIQSAEAWLSRDCQQLEGQVPLELLDNPLGFRIAEEYLARVISGVYQ